MRTVNFMDHTRAGFLVGVEGRETYFTRQYRIEMKQD